MAGFASTWHLYRQEMRRLLPFLCVSLLLFGGGLIETALSSPLDDVSWLSQLIQLDPSEGHFYGFIVLFMAMLFAYGALPREHEDKTIEFLYSLPISRRSIFVAKFLGAWSLMLWGLLAEQGVAWLLQAPNRQSMLGEQFRLDIAWQSFCLAAVVAFFGICHGLLLSYARRFGWLIYGILGLVISALGEHRSAAQILDPSRLLIVQYDGRDMIWPWQGLLLHGGIASVVLLSAYFLWMTTGEEMERRYGLLQRRAWGRVTLGCTSTILVVVCIVWMAGMGTDEQQEAGSVSYRSFQTTHLETQYFRLAFPESIGPAARQLVRRADAIYEDLVQDLADPRPGLIAAQLDGVRSGHLGVELGGVLRASLAGDMAQDQRVFAHETAHVLQWHLAERRRFDAKGLRFFLEGSADYLAARRYASPETKAANRLLAALIRQRHELDFDDLLDVDDLGRRFDEGWVYVLGERWTAALVEHCGEDAILRTLRALGRSEAPEDIDGLALWQDTLRAAGCDLEATLATWHVMMSEEVTAHAEDLERLPKLSGGPSHETDDGIHSVVDLEMPPDQPWDGELEVFLRLRKDATSEVGSYLVLTATWPDEDMEETTDGRYRLRFTASRRQLGPGPFEYQLGMRWTDADWAYFDTWQYIALTDASGDVEPRVDDRSAEPPAE